MNRRSVSEETKKRIVRYVVVDGKSQNEAARDSGFGQSLISGWVKKYGDEVKREAHQDEHDLEKAMADAAEEARERHKAELQAEAEKAMQEQAIKALMEEKPGRPAEDPLPVIIAQEEPEPEPKPLDTSKYIRLEQRPEPPKPLDTSEHTRLEPQPEPLPPIDKTEYELLPEKPAEEQPTVEEAPVVVKPPKPEPPATVRMKTTRAEGRLITMNLSGNGMIYISQQKAGYAPEQIPLLAAEIMAGLAMLGTETETTI